mgnify:CR=1 FL=1
MIAFVVELKLALKSRSEKSDQLDGVATVLGLNRLEELDAQRIKSRGGGGNANG